MYYNAMSMNTTTIGRSAEIRVSEFLKSQGHKIVSLNWRTRWCEIDIVSTKQNLVFFTEVKYRSSDSWGEAIDYISAKKMKQMRFAAEVWLAEHKWTGDAALQAASVNAKNEITLIEL